MAKEKREWVWLECPTCNHKNYRTERSMINSVVRLELNKYCKWCNKHTKHKENRKK
jgi:large subunit ribosomal protein L33